MNLVSYLDTGSGSYTGLPKSWGIPVLDHVFDKGEIYNGIDFSEKVS